MCTQAWLDPFWSAAVTHWTLLMGDKWQCRNLLCFSLFLMRLRAGTSLKTWKGTAELLAISRRRIPVLKKITASMVIYPTANYYSVWNAVCSTTKEPGAWGLDSVWIESIWEWNPHRNQYFLLEQRERNFCNRFQQPFLCSPPAINGYVMDTLPGLVMAQDQKIRWYLLSMGSNENIHSIHFSGHVFTVRKKEEYKMAVYNLYPGMS